jgi:hypothetical protein
MELTVKLLREWFHQFNAAYFENVLPEPKLLVSKSRTQLGQFSCRRVRKGLFSGYQTVGFTIKVSEFYDIPERECQQTLLHEMIHYYIAFTGAKDTSPHGRLFRELMMRLNAVGAWHITVSSRTGQYQVRQQAAEAQYLLMLLTTKDGKHYISVVNPSFRKFIERQASQSLQVTTCQWVVSRDTRYATWPKTRSLRGRRITEVEYLQIIHNS